MSVETQQEFGSRFTPQGHFGTIHAKNAGIASWGAQGSRNLRSGQKPKFHQTLGDVFGKVDAIEYAMLAGFELGEADGRPGGPPPLLETQLHYNLSMKLKREGVNTP